MTRIVLHVERLVLHGYERADGAAVARSLQRELGRQLDGRVAALRLARRPDAPVVAVPNVRIPMGTPPARVGAQVARRLAQGIVA